MASAGLTFLGAAGTVTGSKTLVELGGRRILVDCGLFAGFKHLRLRNWSALPFPPGSIHDVLLTHAHLDHSGYIPRLVRDGYRGPVRCTSGTRDLAGILLPDSGYLQEEDAEYLNRQGYTRHKPALPLYTERDARRCLDRFETVDFDVSIELGSGVSATFRRAGHILGAAGILVTHRSSSVFFSGDLGRPDDPIMHPPARPPRADIYCIESTYGDRVHGPVEFGPELARVINDTVERDGVLLVPSFAVGRAQLLLYHIQRLMAAHQIPRVPVYLNSPMATAASRIYAEHVDEHRLTPDEVAAVERMTHHVASVDESKRLNEKDGPMIIVAGSGMVTGGRILHHLRRFAPDPDNTVLFVGYQAAGTRGAAMIAGADEVKIHRRMVPVRAHVENLAFSAHADAHQTVEWLRRAPEPPQIVYLMHGEPEASEALRQRIQDALGWTVSIAEEGRRVPFPLAHGA